MFIQSFEVANLRELDQMTRVPLVQLLWHDGQPYDFTVAGRDTTYADMATARGLRRIARYADGVGPEKRLIVPVDGGGRLQEPTSLVDDAHRAGLLVHPHTFRNENVFMAPDFRRGDPAAEQYASATGDAPAEYQLYLGLGVDGLFSDHPDTAVAARHEWRTDR